MVKIKKDKFNTSGFKTFLLDNLGDMGISTDSIDIKVKNDGKIILRGEVSSEREKRKIVESVKEIVGAVEIANELIILEGMDDDCGMDMSEYDENDGDIMDEDNEYVGTQDVFRSVEDGVPYIPPMSSSYGDPYGDSDRRRNRRRSY